MPNTPPSRRTERKERRALRKLARNKSADKFLEELSEKKFQPGKNLVPNRTPQTDVIGRPIPKAKSGEPQMRDSEGNLMTPGEQRRAIRRVRRAETKAEKAKEKAKKKAEKEKRKASKPNRTPQTDVIGRRIG
tara:strand:+ start:1310 stop:1708 length:399 start_codon:yes stop_codon:yes gene_type:complete